MPADSGEPTLPAETVTFTDAPTAADVTGTPVLPVVTDIPRGPSDDNESDPDVLSLNKTNAIMALFAALVVGIWAGIAVGFLIWGRRNRRSRGKDNAQPGRDVFVLLLCACLLFSAGKLGMIGAGRANAAGIDLPDDSERSAAPEDTAPADATPTPDEVTAVPAEPTSGAETETPFPDDETPSPADDTATPGDETPTPGDETPTPGDKTPTPGEETPTPGDETPTPGDETPTPGDETATPDMTDEPTETPELPTKEPTPSPTRTPYPTRTPTAVPEETVPPTLPPVTPPQLGDATRVPHTDEHGNLITDTPAPTPTNKAEHVALVEEDTAYRLSDFIQTLCYIAYGLAALLLLIGLIRIIWLLAFKKDIVPPAKDKGDSGSAGDGEGKRKKRRLNRDVNAGDVEMKKDNWN